MNDIDWEEIFLDADFYVPDKRGGERHGVQIKVAWVYESIQYKGISGDISAGGLFVATSQLMASGTEFKLAFKLPTCDEAIRAIARVAWVREESGDSPEEPRGFGVEFLTMAKQDRANVEQFLHLREALLLTDADK